MKITAIKTLQDYHKQHDTLVECAAVTHMPTRCGTFKAYDYRNLLNGEHHMTLVKGEIGDSRDLLCRVHSECLTGDTLGFLRCDYGQQLATAMARIEREGREVLLYMRQEDRGIGFLSKLQTYKLQDQDVDTPEANLVLGFLGDLREYFIDAQMSGDLGAKTLRLLTNNLGKVYRFFGSSLGIKERVPIQMTPTDHNLFYLRTKEQRMGHPTHY